MDALRRFLAILAADLRDRTRSARFWVVLAGVGALTWWCFPAIDAGYMTVGLGDHARGAYSSAWIGMVIALMYGTLLSLVGFYLVRGTLVRDFETRVWQLLVATPMTRRGYLLAKWSSHMAVFALMTIVGAAIGLVAQWLRAEDRAIDLVELAKPLVVIALPSFAMTAFFAILFDLVPWLRRSGGNVLYFFVWMTVFVTAMTLLEPSKVAGAQHTWLSDPNGVSLAERELYAHAVAQGMKPDDAGLSIGMNPTSYMKRFEWSHWSLRPADVLGRLPWLLLPMLGVIALAPWLDRAASKVQGGNANAVSRPGAKLRWLDPLLRPFEAFAAGTVFAAELRLVLRQRGSGWWLAMINCALVEAFGQGDAVGIAVIAAWLCCTDVFARAVLRERDTRTGALVFAAAGAVPRLLLARIGVAFVIAFAAVAPAIIRMAGHDASIAIALAASAAGIAVAGLALGAACRSPRPFELAIVALAYAGIQNVGPLAVVVKPADALHLQAFLLPACAVALALLWPRLARAGA